MEEQQKIERIKNTEGTKLFALCPQVYSMAIEILLP